MKLSELIKEITQEANDKFVDSNHSNDVVTLSVGCPDDEWFVSLQKPSQRQLDMMGEHDIDSCHTVKLFETECRFSCHGDDLMNVLKELRSKIADADECSWND